MYSTNWRCRRSKKNRTELLNLRPIIYTNCIVSLSSGLLAWGLAHYASLVNDLQYGIFVFFVTFAVYNLQRIVKSFSPTQNEWHHWVGLNRRLLIALSALSGFAALGVLFFEIGFDWTKSPWHIPVLLLSLFYVIRVGGKNLREVPTLKIVWIALSWVYVLYLFPLINEGIRFNQIIAIGLFLYVVAVTIPFDIRDLPHDSAKQLTIPQLIGERLSRILSILLLIAAFGLFASVEKSLLESVFFYLIGFIHIVFLFYAKEKQGALYAAGIVDGMISLTGIMFLMLQ